MSETERDISSISSRQKVYQYIKDCITSLSLRPGDMIHERDLAQTLGMSRTPVREALQSLQDEGWLTVIPRKGYVVCSLSKTEIEEVLQLRIIVGTAGIRLSVGRTSPAAIAHLKALVAQQEAAIAVCDYAKFIEIDMLLHIAMVQLAGNRRLSSIAEALLDTFQRVGLEAIRGKREFSEPLAEHKRIIAALEEGDGVTAERLLVEHIEFTRQALL